MKFTAMMGCEGKGIEDKIDQSEKKLSETQAVSEERKHVSEVFGTLRSTLEMMPDNEEALRLVNELDDSFVQLETEILRALAGTNRTIFQVVYDCVTRFIKEHLS